METKLVTGWSVAYSSYHSNIFLNNCDLSLFILVTRMKYLDYCKMVEEIFNFVAQDILARIWLKILIVFPETWIKHSLGFSRFFSFLHQFIDLKKKTRWKLIQSTNIKYTLFESQNYLHDCYYSIRKQDKNIWKVNQKKVKKPQRKKTSKKLVIQVIIIKQAPRNVL